MHPAIWAMDRLVNPAIRAVLRSPAHGLLDGSLAVVRYTGRRTGKEYQVVVMYAADGADFVVLVGWPSKKVWWKNLREPAPVTFVHRGREIPATAHVVDAPEERERFRGIYRARFGAAPAGAVVIRVERSA